MNINRITIIFVVSLFMKLGYAQPATIQRYAWVGGNEDGTIVALMLSHFGPASQAPFAKLIVKEAGNPTPLFIDGAYKRSGGEKELAELGLYLLNKNTDNLKSYGIKLSNEFLSEANSVSPPNLTPGEVSGWVDIENDGVKDFTVKSIPSGNCQKNSAGIALKIEFNGADRLVTNPSPDECWNDGFMLRNIFRTRKALWFILNMHSYGLTNLEAYWVEIQGITLSDEE